MKSYKTPEERPISDVMKERKEFYAGLIGKALDTVYSSGNFSYIGKFEEQLAGLSAKALKGLEKKVAQAPVTESTELTESPESPQSPTERKPFLTSYQYAKCRDKGMTNEEIKSRFRLQSPKQMGAFALNYERSKAKKGDK